MFFKDKEKDQDKIRKEEVMPLFLSLWGLQKMNVPCHNICTIFS